jgi:hypothetical protein
MEARPKRSTLVGGVGAGGADAPGLRHPGLIPYEATLSPAFLALRAALAELQAEM